MHAKKAKVEANLRIGALFDEWLHWTGEIVLEVDNMISSCVDDNPQKSSDGDNRFHSRIAPSQRRIHPGAMCYADDEAYS